MSDYIVRAAAADLQIRAFAITSRELVEKPVRFTIQARWPRRPWGGS